MIAEANDHNHGDLRQWFFVLLPFFLYLISGFGDLDSLCSTYGFGDLDFVVKI